MNLDLEKIRKAIYHDLSKDEYNISSIYKNLEEDDFFFELGDILFESIELSSKHKTINLFCLRRDAKLWQKDFNIIGVI